MPFLVVLRELTEELRRPGRTLAELLRLAARDPYHVELSVDEVEYLLCNGRAVVLLDGLDERQHAGGGVAHEGGDGVVAGGRRVEMASIGTDREGLRALEAGVRAHEGEDSGVCVAEEDRDSVGAGGVDIGPVGADGDGVHAGETGDGVDAVPLALDEGERAGAGVADEDGEGVVLRARRVHVGAVGADRDGGGATEPLDPGAPLLVFLDEGEGAGRGVDREDRERAVAAAGGVEARAVGAERERLRGVEAVHAGGAVVVRGQVREAVGGERRARGGEEDGERECVKALGHLSASGWVCLMCHGAGTRIPASSITAVRWECQTEIDDMALSLFVAG